MSWFDDARFGMFIHWGHSSQRGLELSWPLVGGGPTLPGRGVTVAEYHASAATFNPVHWDARDLARRAREAGMRYAVLTTKHHDGFSMFDTAQSDFSIMHTPFARDVVREFADAMRAEGLRVGFYYSLIDWHHPDYPAFEESDKPYHFGQARRGTPDQWERFRSFMFAQVRELLTNYGQVDVLWFDGHWERTREEWRSNELRELIRSLQPDCLVNDRYWGHPDFETPEQFIPPRPPEKRWEVCMTMNESWGYNPSDTAWKPARELVHTLCEVAGRGGNLLPNVCPMGDGRLPGEVTSRLDAIGRWMARNGESILGTSAGVEPWQFYGPSTRRGQITYLHLLMRPYQDFTLRGVPVKRVQSVHSLASGAPLQWTARTSILDQMFGKDPLGELRIALPESELDDFATVVAVEFQDNP